MSGRQSDRHRVTVVGRLYPHGGPCTVQFVREPGRLTHADIQVITDGLAAA